MGDWKDPASIWVTRVLRDGVAKWMIAGEPIAWTPKVDWLSALATTFVEVKSVKREADRDKAILTGHELLPLLRNTRTSPDKH